MDFVDRTKSLNGGSGRLKEGDSSVSRLAGNLTVGRHFPRRSTSSLLPLLLHNSISLRSLDEQ